MPSKAKINLTGNQNSNILVSICVTLRRLNYTFDIHSFEFLYCRGSQSSSGPASAGPHPPSGPAPFGLPANRSSAASLTEELRKTLESNYLDGGFSTGLPGSGGGQHKTSSREKVKSNFKPSCRNVEIFSHLVLYLHLSPYHIFHSWRLQLPWLATNIRKVY